MALGPFLREMERSGGLVSERTAAHMRAWEIDGADRISGLSETLIGAEIEALCKLLRLLVMPQP